MLIRQVVGSVAPQPHANKSRWTTLPRERNRRNEKERTTTTGTGLKEKVKKIISSIKYIILAGRTRTV